MCGISAIVDFGGDPAALDRALVAAHRALAHRGPDGEAFLRIAVDGSARRLGRWEPGGAGVKAAIAFHQLKVQDLSAEAVQPLASLDETTWIALNGEIYNAGELRLSLCERGHRFRTRSDAEVAMAAYREWGVQCVERFRGMWALLIADVSRRRLIGSRDRLGIKPLYYAVEPERLIFASEPQAIVRARQQRPRAHGARIREFLSGVPPESPRDTFFDGVRLMPEASVCEIDLQASRCEPPAFRRFWNLRDYVPAPGEVPPFEQATREVRSHLASAIDEHAEAAVPIGCLLSGGLDTSYVARSLAERAQARGDTPVPAYSIVFGERDMSEQPFIWSVVRPGGLQSHTYQLTPLQAWHDVDTVIATQAQPLLGQDLIAQYHAYRLARAHGSVVVLEGQGADEVLAGMPSYAAARFDELFAEGAGGRLAVELWFDSRSRGASRLRAAARIARWLARKAVGPRSRPSPEWLEPGAFATHNHGADWEPSRDRSGLNQALFRLVTRSNLPTVLQYQDRSAMAHGVESRVPFLDHRFVEYCFRLPPEYKVYRGRYKRVLAAAAEGLVPQAVLARRDKKTFISKTNWIPLRDAHASALREMASSPTIANTGWFKPKSLSRFVDDYLQGRHDDGPALWRLYTAWRWLELFEVRP